MDEKRRELQQLFHTWKNFHRSRGSDPSKFVSDGFVGDEADYASSATRVLFLLKDPNDSGDILKNCGFDLCQLWRYPENIPEYSNRKVERTCGAWADGIHCAAAGTGSNYERSRDSYRHALMRSAVVNVKKTAGVSTVDTKVLRQHAERDREFILREIEILRPDVVVCGGVFEDIAHPVFKGFLPIGGSNLCFLRDDALWIDHHHPRLGSRWSYKVLLATYRAAITGM